ncbi:hypothetical protein ABZS65_21730, partial [Micromonospora sp. NPDC005313]
PRSACAAPRSTTTSPPRRTPAADDPATIDATVATHLGSGVPVLLVQGRDDVAVPAAQSIDLTGRLLAAGHPAHLWLTHGGHALDLARPDLRAAAAAFLDSVLPAVAGD